MPECAHVGKSWKSLGWAAEDTIHYGPTTVFDKFVISQVLAGSQLTESGCTFEKMNRNSPK